MGNLKVEKQELHNELEALVVQIQEMIDRNARVVQNQESYQVQYNQLIMSYNLKKERYDELEILMTKRQAKFEKLAVFIQNLEQIDDIIKEFAASMWGSLVEYLKVDRDKKAIVVFKDGTQIKIEN